MTGIEALNKALEVSTIGNDPGIDLSKLKIESLEGNFWYNIKYSRSMRDDDAYLFLGRIQGKYKGLAVIKRLKNRNEKDKTLT